MTQKKAEASTSSAVDATKNSADDFTRQTEQALEHFTEPSWLGEHSPLAAPYFLGERLAGQSGADTPAGRGRLLQQLLIETALTLADGSQNTFLDTTNMGEVRKRLEKGNFDQRLLYWYFLHHPRPSREIIISRLGVQLAPATYHRRIKDVTKQFAGALVRRINPALRLEAPQPPHVMVGREDVIENCVQALADDQSVALTGPGGIGKTALAASVLARLAPQQWFWFTINPGLNDNLGSLLFQLSYFLHSLGASSAWRQLVADAGALKIDVVQSLIQHDLSSLPSPKPVLCFDEFDLLRPSEVKAHAQVLGYIESLRGQVALLLLGQRLAVDVDSPYSLDGLDREPFEALLMAKDIQLSSGDLARLHTYTNGNPRLVELFISLYRSGVPLAAALNNIAVTPSVDALLGHILECLPDEERTSLLSLTVFRRPVPSNAWNETVVQSLVDRHLVQRDGRGGVALLPAFRTALYQQIPLELRETLHLKAAAVRVQYQEFTAAAHHYVKSGRPAHAIRLWNEHQTQEINQGQATAALELFSEISPGQLSVQDRETLTLLHSRLLKLLGRYSEANQGLQATLWQTPILKAQAKRLEGEIADLQKAYELSIDAYQEGLETVQGLLGNEVVWFRKSLSRIYMLKREGDRAWQESQVARYEVENIQGNIEEWRGKHPEAMRHYLAALQLAHECKSVQAEAKTRTNLARLLSLQGAFDQALPHLQTAYQLFSNVGNLESMASVRVNQALHYNLLQLPGEAILFAEDAWKLFEQIGDPYGKAVAAQNLAEAHLALGQLEQAEYFASYVVSAADANTLPDGLRVLGEVRLAQGNLVAAEELIMQSIQITKKNQDRYLEAYGWRALGRVHQAQHTISKAQTALVRARELFDELALSDEVECTEALMIVSSNGYSEL